MRIYTQDPAVSAVTVRKMRCLILQRVCWEIGRRGGKAVSVNADKPGLHLEQSGPLVKNWALERDDQGIKCDRSCLLAE